MSASNWKDALQGLMPDKLAHEIDIFQAQFELKRQGKIEDKVFAETRLRRGAYGQRYDNGQRHDGKQTRPLNFPCGDLTKGPDTVWDAPGMVRIKIPYGGMTPDRLEVMADCAEEYSDGILHVTTRQDIQLHFVHIDDLNEALDLALPEDQEFDTVGGYLMAWLGRVPEQGGENDGSNISRGGGEGQSVAGTRRIAPESVGEARIFR